MAPAPGTTTPNMTIPFRKIPSEAISDLNLSLLPS